MTSRVTLHRTQRGWPVLRVWMKSFVPLWLLSLHLHAWEHSTVAEAVVLKTAAEADLLKTAAEADLLKTAASADLLKTAASAGLQGDFAFFPFFALLGRSGKSALDGIGGDGTLWLS